jgi:hypothetical protein
LGRLVPFEKEKLKNSAASFSHSEQVESSIALVVPCVELHLIVVIVLYWLATNAASI